MPTAPASKVPQANRHRSDRGRHRGHDEADENHPNLWHITDGVEHEPKRKSIEQEDPKLEAHCLGEQDGLLEEMVRAPRGRAERSGHAEQPASNQAISRRLPHRRELGEQEGIATVMIAKMPTPTKSGRVARWWRHKIPALRNTTAR